MNMASDGPADGAEVALLDRQRDIGADARQGDWYCPTLMASAATTKNQPPDIYIIMFQMSAGHGERHLEPPEAHARADKRKRARPRRARRGMLRSDW